MLSTTLNYKLLITLNRLLFTKSTIVNTLHENEKVFTTNRLNQCFRFQGFWPWTNSFICILYIPKNNLTESQGNLASIWSLISRTARAISNDPRLESKRRDPAPSVVLDLLLLTLRLTCCVTFLFFYLGRIFFLVLFSVDNKHLVRLDNKTLNTT